MGHDAFEQGYAQGGFGGQDFGNYANFSDIFGDLFRGFGGFGGFDARPQGPRKGQNLRISLEVTFEEAAFGTQKSVEINRREKCPECGGSGAKKGTSKETCDKCGGTGQVRVMQNTLFGQSIFVKTCDKCGGTGQIIKNPCPSCNGKGVKPGRKKITINVPKGVDNGTRIRLENEGEVGEKGGPRGDLYVDIRVKPHKLFTRKENDVILKVPITYAQAVLGDEIEVPTLYGTEKVRIPEGTQHNQVFRLRGKGIPNIRNGYKGDQQVVVNILIPKGLNEDQKNLLREFSKSCGMDVHPQKKGFIDKMKDAFR